MRLCRKRKSPRSLVNIKQQGGVVMTQEKSFDYKQHKIIVAPHDEKCSHYAYEIRDGDGNELKKVKMGGDTEEVAVKNAQKMIDFELAYEK